MSSAGAIVGGDNGFWPARRIVWLLLALHAASALLFMLDTTPATRAAWHDFPLDDAWIHLVYARSIGQLQGFAYNPGVQEAGSTSPLWAIVLAPFTWLLPLGVTVTVVAIKAFTVLLAFLSSCISFRLARRWTGSVLSATVAAALPALDPSLTFAKVAGMEVILAGLLSLWLLERLDARDLRASGVLLALLPLTRPELGVLWVPAIAICLIRLHQTRAPLRAWLWAALPSLLCLGGWLAFCLAVSGRPLPNTFYAKHALMTDKSFLRDAAIVLGPALRDLPWSYLGSGALLVAAGLLRMLSGTSPLREPARWLLPLHVILFLLAVAWAHSLSQWQPFYWNRYLQPVLPVLYLPLGIGLGGAIQVLADRLRGRSQRTGLALAATLLAPLCVASVPGRLVERAHLYAMNCQNLDEIGMALGLWLREHVPPGAWIASHDAGSIHFFSERPLVDLLGLNNRAVLDGHRVAELQRHNVHWFIANPGFLNIGKNPRFRPVHGVVAPVYTICDCPDQRWMFVYEQTRPAPGGHAQPRSLSD